MDQPGPFSGVERTFWTVWNYITEAVARFLRPQATDTGNNGANSVQESAAVSEPGSCGRAESDLRGREGDEEQAPLATASVVNLSRTAVAWESGSGPQTENKQCATPLNRGSESPVSDGGEGMREEQAAQTANQDSGLLTAKDARAKEEEEAKNSDGTRTQDLDSSSTNLTYDAASEDKREDGRKNSLVEEIDQAMMSDYQHKVDETMGNSQDEDKEKLCEEEPGDFKDPHISVMSEETAVSLLIFKDKSLEEEDNKNTEYTGMQKNEEDATVTHEVSLGEETDGSDGVSQLTQFNITTSASGFKSNEGLVEPEDGQVQESLPTSEMMSDEDRAVKGDAGIAAPDTVRHVELQMADNKSSIVADDEITVVRQEQTMAESTARAANSEVEDEKEKEDRSAVVESELGATVEEENVKEVEAGAVGIPDEVREQEDHFEVVTEDSKEEEIIITELITCSEGFTQYANLDVHRCEDEETQHLEVGTKTSEEDDLENKNSGISGILESVHDVSLPDKNSKVTSVNIAVDERSTEEEVVSSEKEKTVSDKERTCTTSAATEIVKPESNNGEETNGEFKTISQGSRVPQELNCIPCGETEEGVPGYNNGHEPDENTTQRFLKGGDYEEIQTTQLPEEVESVQSISSSTEVGHFLTSEHMEEEQDSELESTESIDKSFDVVVEEATEILCLTDGEFQQETEKPLAQPVRDTVTQASGQLFATKAGQLDISMKTGIQQSEKAFGTNDEADGTEKELHDKTEELLVEFALNEELRDPREADSEGAIAVDDGLMIDTNTQHGEKTAAVSEEEVGLSGEPLKSSETESQQMTETRFSESFDATVSEQSSSRTSSPLEDISEPRQSVEETPEFLEDNNDTATEMEAARFDMGEIGSGVENYAAKSESENKTEPELSGDANTEPPVESVETKHEISGIAFETRIEETLIDTELSDQLIEIDPESKAENTEMMLMETEMAKHRTTENVSDLEGSSGFEHTNETDEVLDMQIETVLMENTDDTETKIISESTGREPPEEKEPEPQTDIKMQPSEEVPNELREGPIEQSVESNVAESGSMSDTEITSSTESGFLDKSPDEWGTPKNETHLLTLSDTGPFQDMHGMLVQDILMNESAKEMQAYIEEDQSINAIPGEETTQIGFLGKAPHSKVILSEERHGEFPDESQEERETEKVEPMESETGLQKEADLEITAESILAQETDRKEAEDADVASVAKMKDETLELVSELPQEIKQDDSGQCSETEEDESSAILRESTEPDAWAVLVDGSHGKTCPEAQHQLSYPSLDRAQPGESETEPPRTKSGHQFEVHASILDFTAQRSRIAVKNRHVRPPKNPRSLLQMPSVEPEPSGRPPVKAIAGVPLGGLGIGIKLPGLGAGFPVLKKTPRVEKDENNAEGSSQKSEAEPEVKDDAPKQEEAEHKPKWMPPKHPGFGNPLMSELKSKLKKTAKE
ncbi:microtubule-associated protein futsch [Myripristis murdjan]|uniref:microtubule-associated protein futsch n=1 Tax=Myripristis murdjan TaxID=586833 RepID=UPI001175D0F7|nr:microtubule-associated protein futsch-like [Myripristis murdjan]